MIRRNPAASHRSSSPARSTPPALAPWLACALILLGLPGSIGCATRTAEDRIINQNFLDVYLRSDRKPFGSAIDHGYAHPSQIPVGRLRVILGSFEIERREGARTVREPAIPAELLVDISAGVAEAFREADSSERIAVMAQRKQMQKKIFSRKFLTSFVMWMEGDELVFHLSRSDWEIDEKRQSGLPKPHPNDPQQKFRVVTNEFVRREGDTGVAVAWQSEVFGSFASASALRTAPVAAGASSEKTVLMEGKPAELAEPEALTSEQLTKLSADDLRALADLEEARGAGRVTEDAYRQRRRAILDAAGAD